ncbi:hypothetical protein CCAX7_13200 [Capsulimonas corticalis]|uniref:Uncharacterized protein n=1 Tax=Capsulimonas corticalis TaxID=2219043 RepID=A0A402D4N8_9BACT|nr:hypothetical protein CCAX7_13200 [Capsulimonas corticalis]
MIPIFSLISIQGQRCDWTISQKWEFSEYRFAKLLNITQSQLAELLAVKRNVTPNIALRLGRLFGQTPEMWMNMQNRYDLLIAENTYRDAIEAVRPFVWPISKQES